MTRARRIAVFLPNWVGDVVMATPALRALRAHFGEAHIAYVGRPISLATLGGTDQADAAVADLSRRPPRAVNLLRLADRLRRERCDLAVLLPNSFRTALVAALAGTRRRLGYDRDGRGRLLSDRLAPRRGTNGRPEPVSAVDYYADLVAVLGVRCESRALSLPVASADASAADGLLAAAGVDARRPLVMLNPGASFGPSKLWDPRRFAALADLLVERRGAQIVINAAPAERRVAARVAAAMRYRPALNLGEHDNSLGLVKALLCRCALLVTNDTGARHLGAAMGAGVVTVFGSTDPEWSRIDYDRERIVRVEVDCSPCQQKLCRQVAGPAYHQCMTRITPEMALAPAEELLDAARGPEAAP
jgi:heptosyltransferase-2